MYIEGIDPNRIFTSDELPPAVDATSFEGGYGEALALGTRGRDDLGNSYILLEATGAISNQGEVGFWDENFEFTPVSNGATGVSGGAPLAVAASTPSASGDRFWACVEGMIATRAAAAAAVDTLLTTTATAGAVDDAGGAGTFNIHGLQFMVAATGAGAFQARVFNPHLGSTANV